MKKQTSFLEAYKRKPKAEASEGRIDFKQLKEEKARDFFKFKEGKNSFVFLTEDGSENPFTTFGQHVGLQEVDYWSIPCDAHNKGERCAICEGIETIEAELTFEEKKSLTFPVSTKVENYAKIAIMDDTGNFDPKAYWVRIPPSLITSLVQHEEALDEDESHFYDRIEQSKIVVSYNKANDPKTMYSVSVKKLKANQRLDLKTMDEMLERFKDITYYNLSRKLDDQAKIFEDYVIRKTEQIEQANEA